MEQEGIKQVKESTVKTKRQVPAQRRNKQVMIVCGMIDVCIAH